MPSYKRKSNMAASAKLLDGDLVFQQISSQFMEMVPLRRMKWSVSVTLSQ